MSSTSGYFPHFYLFTNFLHFCFTLLAKYWKESSLHISKSLEIVRKSITGELSMFLLCVILHTALKNLICAHSILSFSLLLSQFQLQTIFYWYLQCSHIWYFVSCFLRFYSIFDFLKFSDNLHINSLSVCCFQVTTLHFNVYRKS